MPNEKYTDFGGHEIKPSDINAGDDRPDTCPECGYHEPWEKVKVCNQPTTDMCMWVDKEGICTSPMRAVCHYEFVATRCKNCGYEKR